MWSSPAFYVAVVSLMANVGNYLKAAAAHNTAKKVQSALANARSVRTTP